MKNFAVVFMLVGVIALFSTGTSRATVHTFGFYNITNNDPADAAIGQEQLFVDVSDEFVDQVFFTFRNIGLDSSAITEIYFDDGTLLGIASIFDNPPDVEFVLFASPPDLPGAESIDPPFQTTTGFLAESTPPPPKRGVNPSEQVGILFDLQQGGTYQNVINELYNTTLRIGIHVTNFDSGGSESFVNVPEPATMCLLGLGGLFFLRKRK